MFYEIIFAMTSIEEMLWFTGAWCDALLMMVGRRGGSDIHCETPSRMLSESAPSNTPASDTALASTVAASQSTFPSRRSQATGHIIPEDVRLGCSKSMSMLSSVFSRRKGFSRKLNNLAHIRRAQSPPSPASFASPDISEKPFNPYSLYNGSVVSQASTHQAAQGGSQPTDDAPVTSPRVQLDLTSESLSDWFSAELLQTSGEAPGRIPERNVSLGVRGIAGSQGSSSRLADLGSVKELSVAEVDEAQRSFDHGTVGDETDDVIVIEATRGREPTRSPITGSTEFSEDRSPGSSSPNQSKRRAPQPIRIPANTSSSKFFLHIDPESVPLSRQPSKRRSGRGSRPVSRYQSRRSSIAPKSARTTSFRKSKQGSLHRSRSRARPKSRASSVHSAPSGTDFETDFEDGLSAISGTTIARALVASYFDSSSPSNSHPSSATMLVKSRGHLARQDSATLPKADYAFFYNRNSLRRSQRSSKGSTASNGYTPNSANYWRDRKISGDQIVILSPEEREKEGWDMDVPPLPPMPQGLSPGPGSARTSGQMQPEPSKAEHNSLQSTTGSSGERASKRISGNSIASRRATKELTVELDPERKRRRISKISESADFVAAPIINSTQPSSGSSEGSVQTDAQDASKLSLPFGSASSGRSKESVTTGTTSVEDGQDVIYQPSRSKPLVSPDAPTTATSSSVSMYSEITHGGSVFSPAESSSIYSSPGSTAVLSPGLTSILSPGSSTVHTPGSSGSANSRKQTFRSFSAARQRRNMSPPKPTINMLPIGERPRSTQVPHSPLSPVTSPLIIRPQSLSSAARSSLDSPDLLDIMFAGSRGPLSRNNSHATRSMSPPAPISVPPRAPFEIVSAEGNSPSAVKQQFPETPYSFTPLMTANFSPQAQDVPPPLPRSGTLNLKHKSKRSSVSMGRKALMRSASLATPPSSAGIGAQLTANSGTALLRELPPTPLSGVDSPHSASGLSMIEEGSAASSPTSRYSMTPEQSPAFPMRRANSEPGASSQPSSPVSCYSPLPPLADTVPYTTPLPPSPSSSSATSTTSAPTSPLKRKHGSFVEVEDQSIPIVHAEVEDGPPLSSPRPSLPPSPLSMEFRSGFESADSNTSLQQQQQPNQLHPVYGSMSRKGRARTRPPPPSGPRRPSGPGNFGLLNRVRAGSMSSVTSSPSLSTGASGSRYTTPESSTPRFQTTPVKFRGLTMEAAQWTFTSQELQFLVSDAVKHSADASAIRLLPVDQIQGDLPEEIERLEKVSADLKTKYKLGMRRRMKLLHSLREIADGGDLADHTSSSRQLEELVELSDNLDHISDDLHNVMDQLRQLTHLRDLHTSSALAMAVRKLNNSFIKHLADNQKLRQQVVQLQEERDDAWIQAQEAAKELDALSEKFSMSEGVITPASSRRSSAAIVARKASMRRAGLRSSSHMRSQRSSVSTNRSSMAISPLNRTPSDVIPPVPPIPVRTPLGLSTAGLSSGLSTGMSRGLSSGVSPDEEVRALMRAQEELYEMLGIKLEELPTVRKRSMSVSDVATPPPYQETMPLPRRNSEVVSPSAARSSSWHEHRAAVLATIGMSP
ncbi:hypothetical protein BDY19DRAFT_103179 [Irpex rosettiformis]|uniref:Uncharacterized protein n=1 Tax=Irpex rosettiformis TaxID=378272 RepID=A0ACB8U508_9APHY|nr:hypothetical protein BDY19DRAFT_103179 [Irpex rosettiformis]